MKLRVVEQSYCDSADLFDKVADQPWAIFLDSGCVNGSVSRLANGDIDVVAIKPTSTLVFDGEVTHFRHGSVKQRLYGDPLEILKASIPPIEGDSDIDVEYMPGALGYLAYDLARQYESIVERAEDEEKLPPMAMGIYLVVVVIDHVRRCSFIVSLGNSSETLALVKEWRDLIEWSAEYSSSLVDDSFGGFSDLGDNGRLISGHLSENMDKPLYKKSFDDVRHYTIEGDCYQVNLSKQFSTPVTGDAWLTYRYLRSLSPAPYGAFINLPFAQVLSNSPESFIRCHDRHVVTSPIKGTRPRNHDDAKMDQIIAKTLFNSAKDRAENLMIVDLMRNDLSRCCELASVKVPSLFSVHSFANVHHLISTITGTLEKHLHVIDLLRSCFPGGSITGAPKIRAMEIIEELEPHRRGLYCGSIGYIGANGDLQTNIAIRTIVVKDGVARYSAGGGLVIDSDMNEEYQEVIDKAKMMTDALFVR